MSLSTELLPPAPGPDPALLLTHPCCSSVPHVPTSSSGGCGRKAVLGLGQDDTLLVFFVFPMPGVPKESQGHVSAAAGSVRLWQRSSSWVCRGHRDPVPVTHLHPWDGPSADGPGSCSPPSPCPSGQHISVFWCFLLCFFPCLPEHSSLSQRFCFFLVVSIMLVHNSSPVIGWIFQFWVENTRKCGSCTEILEEKCHQILPNVTIQFGSGLCVWRLRAGFFLCCSPFCWAPLLAGITPWFCRAQPTLFPFCSSWKGE